MPKWFIRDDSGEHGPYRASEIRDFANRGILCATTLLKKEGMAGFIKASAYRGLIPNSQAAKAGNDVRSKVQANYGDVFEDDATPARSDSEILKMFSDMIRHSATSSTSIATPIRLDSVSEDDEAS